MRLYVFHYHLRSGGIRRIIELGTPWIVKESSPAIEEVTIVSGEVPDSGWKQHMRDRLEGIPLHFQCEPTFHYLAEQTESPSKFREGLRRAVDRTFSGLDPDQTIIWAHNLSIARNLAAADALLELWKRLGFRVILHHHDWWFENRWLRWPEMKRFGIRSLDKSGEVLFSKGGRLAHACINHSDYDVLNRHMPALTHWLPNLTETNLVRGQRGNSQPRQWLKTVHGIDEGPLWTVPCRLLRRKNIAEALLLCRWLRPEATLLVTGGISSKDESVYAEKLQDAAFQGKWRLILGGLQGPDKGKPSVAEVLESSEAVMLTSIQEGFGLPFLEAAGSRRPLIARSLPNIAPDLRKFGFRFDYYYDDLLVEPGLLDLRREIKRQTRVFNEWKKQIPVRCRSWLEPPFLLDRGAINKPIPFSRLTLAAQLEILKLPPEQTWNACARLNPFLINWKTLAEGGRLKNTAWPPQADRWLSGPAYGRRFRQILKSVRPVESRDTHECMHLLEDFIRSKLKSQYLFPLLMSVDSS